MITIAETDSERQQREQEPWTERLAAARVHACERDHQVHERGQPEDEPAAIARRRVRSAVRAPRAPPDSKRQHGEDHER